MAGAYLLARGLLSSLPDIRTSGTYAGLGAQSTVRRVRDRVDGSAGLLFLTSGFLIQAAGYAATAAGLNAGAPSAARAATFAVVTAVVLSLALGLHAVTTLKRTRRLALQTTRLDGRGVPMDKPDGKSLTELGVELGDDAQENETYGSYCERVWGIAHVLKAEDVMDPHERLTRQAGRAAPRRLR